MIYIIAGGVGFLLVHLFDLVSMKRIPLAKPLTWIAGSGLLTYSLVTISLQSEKLLFPSLAVWFGWALLIISASLSIYALFINLPFRKTYIEKGVGNVLIKTGLYSLVRHPGVHWFILFMVSLVLVTGSRLMLIAAPVFVMTDIALVIMQDKFVFVRMFDGYTSYQKETPMLVPNWQSLNTFIRSLRIAKPNNTI